MVYYQSILLEPASNVQIRFKGNGTEEIRHSGLMVGIYAIF